MTDMREYRRVVRAIMYMWCVVCMVMVFVAAVQDGVWVFDDRYLIVALILALGSAVVATVFGVLTYSESTHPVPDQTWAITRTTVSLTMFLAASLLTALCAGTALGATVTLLIRN